MYRRWVPIALFAIAVLFWGAFPVHRETIVLMRRGGQLAAERRYTAALQAYDDAAERCPGCPGPPLRRAGVYLEQGRHNEAWGAHLAALRRGGIGDEATEGMARLYAAQQAQVRTIELLSELLARRPGRGDLWAQLGEAYLAVEDPSHAQSAFERALELEARSEQRQRLHDRLGMTCVEADVECALSHMRKVEQGPDRALAEDATRTIAALRGIAEGSDPAFARAKLGEALLRHGDLPSARRQFEAAVDLEPAYVDGHAYLGHVLSALGEDDPAVEHLERAIALEPEYPLPHYFLGMHYVGKGWTITGREVLEQAHDLDPSNPAICAAVADAHLRAAKPQYAVAEQWLHAAVDNAPDDPRFHLLLAHFYVDYMVDPAVRGVAVAQVAARLAPMDGEAHETLGWAYHLAGRPDLALESLGRARDLAPEKAQIYYRLGEVYRALGRSEQAGQAYQQAVDLDWKGPIGERARQAMEE